MKKRSYEKSDQWPCADERYRYRNREYTGPKKHLQGRSALIIASRRKGYVLAQFSCQWDSKLSVAVFDPMCFGWHMFSQLAFRSRKIRHARTR